MKRIVAFILALVMVFALCGCSSESREEKQYNKAIKLLNEGKYSDAQKIFEELGDYKYSKSKVCECMIKDINYWYIVHQSDLMAAQAASKALEYYQSLSKDEQSNVSNKDELWSEDKIIEVRMKILTDALSN